MCATVVPQPVSRRVGRRLGVLLLVLLAALVTWWTLAWFLQRAVLYPRAAASGGDGVVPERHGIEPWFLDIGDGRVEAWLALAPGATAERPAPAVVFAHGNAEWIDHQLPVVEQYRRLGVTVLLPEYRGYGRSAGSPSQEALVTDAQRFLERLLARPDVDPSRLVFHGRSVGCGVVCALALRHAPAALVLESPFRNVARLAAGVGVPAFLVRDRYDNESALRALEQPVLIFHGRHDGIVPFAHGAALASAARRATLVAYECGHNDLPPDPATHAAHLGDFLRENGVLR